MSNKQSIESKADIGIKSTNDIDERKEDRFTGFLKRIEQAEIPQDWRGHFQKTYTLDMERIINEKLFVEDILSDEEEMILTEDDSAGKEIHQILQNSKQSQDLFSKMREQMPFKSA